jgi:L,D-transpeptidase catalytic domain
MGRTARTIIILALGAALAGGVAVAWMVLDDEYQAPTLTTVAVAHSNPGQDDESGGNGEPGRDRAPRPSGFRPLPLYPRGYPLVWVRRGERVELRDKPGGKLVKKVGEETFFRSRTVFAVFERRGRWAGVPTPFLPNGELAWLRLDARYLRAGWSPFEVVVDLSERNAVLMRGRRKLRSFRVTVGAPGSETPTGRFAVTDTFRGGLNPVYGCCAVALTATQPRLPSGWLGGNRIAIHGTSGSLGVADSFGCVRAADENVDFLVERAYPGTPVEIRQ